MSAGESFGVLMMAVGAGVVIVGLLMVLFSMDGNKVDRHDSGDDMWGDGE